MINSAQAQDRYNKNWESAQAQRQMDFQEQSNAKAMAFSAQQAQISRDFEERMSNTAHQREVKDLVSAGLNPILSATRGASTPNSTSASGVSSSGSKGNTDSSMTQMFSGMLQAVISQATALQTTSMNNMTSLETTKMINDMSSKVAQIGASAMLGTANINARTNLTMQQQAQAFEEYMKANYPQTVPGSVNALKEQFENWLKQNGNGKSFGENIATRLKMRQEEGFWLNKDGKAGSW